MSQWWNCPTQAKGGLEWATFEDVIDHDIFEDFEVNGLSDGGVGRGDRAIGSDLDRGAVLLQYFPYARNARWRT